MSNSTSVLGSILFPVVSNVAPSASIVASLFFLLLNRTMTGSPPKRLATILAAPVASLRNTSCAPESPNDTTAVLRASSANAAAVTVTTEMKAMSNLRTGISKAPIGYSTTQILPLPLAGEAATRGAVTDIYHPV
jgi:hypothetical protein